jgi:lipoprotein-anchoring transpeptidase ErfK/SrfK
MMISYRRLTLAPSIAAQLMCAVFAFMALTLGALPASAGVLISVDKRTQQMSVSVDGSQRYRFAVSTGRAGYGTPSGTYHPERLETAWFSKEYYNSPMPHSIFFHGGFAIHGSYEINRLGGPASHGCIRLHPANAATLFTLVKSKGMAATTIVVSGSNPIVAQKPAPATPRPDDGGNSPGYDNRYWPQPPGYSWPQEPSNFPFSNIY